jgi:hypothetical protein
MRPRCRADSVVLVVFVLLRALCAGEDVASLRGSCSPGPGWWFRAARLMNSWLVTPMGLADVTSRYRFRAAGLGRKLDKHSK